MSDYAFLEDYSATDLRGMIPVIESLIKKKEKSEKENIRKQIAEMAAEQGYTIDELFSNKPLNSRKPAKAKYYNPEDPTQTWSGRGRKPLWVAALLESGKNLEDFEL